MDVEVKAIEVRLPGEDSALFRVKHWRVHSGARVLVQGASGQGKTTLLHLIAGLLRPFHGNVHLTAPGASAVDLAKLGEAEQARFRRESMGLVFQKLNLLPHLTAMENVIVAMASVARGERFERAQKALVKMGLSHRMQTAAADLSLGEQQRVAVARVLATLPMLVLADEPTSSLDDASAEIVTDALLSLPKDRTLIVVSHDHRLRARFKNQIEFSHFSEKAIETGSEFA